MFERVEKREDSAPKKDEEISQQSTSIRGQCMHYNTTEATIAATLLLSFNASVASHNVISRHINMEPEPSKRISRYRKQAKQYSIVQYSTVQ